MEFDTESSFTDTGSFAADEFFHDTIHAELPTASPYVTTQQVLASGDNNAPTGFAGLDGFVNRAFATGESLIGLWGKAQNLELSREAMRVRTAAAKTDLEIAKAQNEARQAIEIGKAQATAAAAQAGATTAKTLFAMSPGAMIGLAALAFVAAKLLKGKK